MSKSVKLANSLLLSGIIICIAIFLYAFSISDSRPAGSVHKYYAITLLLSGVFTAVLLRCKDETKKNIALLFFSIAAGLYIMEIILFLYGSALPAGSQKQANVPLRTKFQIMMDLREKNITAYTHYFPANLLVSEGLEHEGVNIFPLGAISNITTVFCIDDIGSVIYKTDEHGFRNPAGQYDTAAPDIVLIGDSFAQGHCVKNGEDIAGQLRENGRKVLNLGMEGSGPLIELAIFNEYAKHLKPKNVFWLYWEGNDALNLKQEKGSSVLMSYLDEKFSQNLVQHQALIDNALIAHIEKKIPKKENRYVPEKEPEVKRSKYSIMNYNKLLMQLIKLYNLRLQLGLHSNCNYYTDPLLNDILLQVKSRTENWGGQFYFVYLPSANRYQGSICNKRMLSLQQEKISSLTKDLNINFIDMTVQFDAYTDSLSLFHGHYNSKGYGLVAKTIEESAAGSSN